MPRSEPPATPPTLAQAEVLGALACAADLANGFPLGKVLRTSLLAAELARAAGLDEATAGDAYHLTQLRYLGCTSFAHEEAHRYGAGDDIAVRNTMAMADAADVGGTLGRIVGGIAPGAPLFAKAQAIVRLVGGDAVAQHAHAQCNGAILLGRMIGTPEPLLAALASICERWDGRGAPRGLAAEAIPVATRLHLAADVLEIAHHRGGLAAATELARARRGTQLDPALSDTFLAHAPALGARLSGTTLWESFLAAEPAPRRMIDAARIDDAARALGYFADLKSTWLLGHSQRVADLVAATAGALGLDADEARLAVRAAHLHDIGRVAIASGTWDRPGPLGAFEWEQVRQHTYHTDRVLALSPALASLRPIAGSAHERGGGDGYHRGLGEAHLPVEAKVLAVCDAIVAMGEGRPHRAALGRDAIAAEVARAVKALRWDARAADAALACAGLAAAVPGAAARVAPGLSEREREVLVWVARGKTNKEIGIVLGISARTVQVHVAHIYDKIGVSSRAGAAIFAMEHRII